MNYFRMTFAGTGIVMVARSQDLNFRAEKYEIL